MDGWEPAVVAAVVAACSALVAAAMSVATARSARRSNERARFWERLSWAVQELDRPDRARYDIPATVLDQLRFVRWAGPSDRDLAGKIAGLTETRCDEPPEGDPGR
ncbi:hypothetical protein ASF23_00510 [Curtobacterium sp. Leaf261]|nr:hypothetical protein ASF23_00510 [Curtobacterium sp. Leaf261]